MPISSIKENLKLGWASSAHYSKIRILRASVSVDRVFLTHVSYASLSCMRAGGGNAAGKTAGIAIWDRMSSEPCC